MPASLMMALGCLGMSPGAHAQYPPPLQCTLSTTPTTITFNDINIARDAPIGAPLSEIRSSVTTFNCPPNAPWWMWGRYPGFFLQMYTQRPVSLTVPSSWETGMPGIGIRVVSVEYDTVMSSLRSFGPNNFTRRVNAAGVSGHATFTYQLIKTGSITVSGPLSIGELFRLVSHNIPYDVTSPTLSSVAIVNSNITARSCSVTTPSVGVSMPTVSRASLVQGGAAAGATPFRINIACPSDSRVRVYMTFSDVTTPGNRTDRLTLTPDSTARGVRLQITGPSGRAVRYGPDSPNPRNFNQFLVGPSETTSDILFIAEYVATGAVTPGTVVGLATFTMSYQ